MIFVSVVGVMIVMRMIMRVVIALMATFAIGAVALADMLFFLPDEHPIAIDGHIKAAFTFKNYFFSVESIEKQRFFEGGHRRRVGLVELANINEYTLTILVIMLQKGNYCIGLRGIKRITEADVEVVVTEAVGNIYI
ncbi:MAG: hypothetical protein PHI96_07680 [Desulfovibrio sp.]|nr:hypothetical protein [Desulfovibrio sp.]